MEGFCHSMYKYFSLLKEGALANTCDRLMWLSWLVNLLLYVLFLNSHFMYLGQPSWTKSVEMWSLVIVQWGMCPDSLSGCMMAKKARKTFLFICNIQNFVCLLFLFVLTHPVQKNKSFDVVESRWRVKRHFHSQFSSKETPSKFSGTDSGR